MKRYVMIAMVLACGGHPAPPNNELAGLVVAELGAPAFGEQKIEARCVKVSTPAIAAGKTVAMARLDADPKCGDDSARSMVWIYVRAGSGGWSEQYLGPAPKCWKGVPAEIAAAVAQTSGIPGC